MYKLLLLRFLNIILLQFNRYTFNHVELFKRFYTRYSFSVPDVCDLNFKLSRFRSMKVKLLKYLTYIYLYNNFDQNIRRKLI